MPTPQTAPAPASLAAEAPNPIKGGVFIRNPATGELSLAEQTPAPTPPPSQE